MTGFTRRPLTVFICCMFAGISVGHAASDAPRPAPVPGEAVAVESRPPFAPDMIDRPLSLRVERKFNLLDKKKTPLVPSPVLGPVTPTVVAPKDSYPLFIIADLIRGITNELTEAEGKVELRKPGMQVYGDKLTYWPLEDEVDASGHAQLFQDGAEFATPHLRMKISEQTGYAETPDYSIVKDVPSRFYQQLQTVVTVASGNAVSTGAPMMLNVPNSYGLPTTIPPNRPTEANGHAELAEFQGENQIQLTKATYSTCKPGQSDWYLLGSDIHLDYDNDVGNARNASVWFKDVPLLYAPVASFSLNHNRNSGFLHPFFSASTRNGLDFTVPYYWNIAPNYDATFYPRYLAKRGFQLGAETQYLDYYARGTVRAEYLPNDEVLNRQRFAYTIQHWQDLGRGFSATVNWQGVSDSLYWTDMSSRLLQTSQTQLPKQIVLGYSPFPWLQSSIQMLHYQTLQPDLANPIARPYFIEPQINVVGYKPNVLNTDISLLGQYSRFTNPDKIEGERVVFYPQVSLPIIHPAFQITPKFGLHMTQYALDQQTAGQPTSISRVLPTFTLDSTVVFERETKWLDTDYIQTLEPRLYYVNIPYKNQSQIPVFDSGLNDFNFAQIFGENRYSGLDRINDANQLTAGVTTRLLDANTGVERFKAMLGQRYYFTQQHVTITGETPRTTSFSNLVLAANGLVAPKTYADVAWEYNYHDGVSEQFSAGARFQPELAKVISASYRFTRDALTGKSTVGQIDLAGQWPISAQWYAVGRYNYSLRDKQLLEAVGGLEYNAGCWAARAVIQRLEAVAGSPNTTFFLQLELNDLGSIGSNPLGLLRRSIPGYGKTNELPTSSSLLTSP